MHLNEFSSDKRLSILLAIVCCFTHAGPSAFCVQWVAKEGSFLPSQASYHSHYQKSRKRCPVSMAFWMSGTPIWQQHTSYFKERHTQLHNSSRKKIKQTNQPNKTTTTTATTKNHEDLTGNSTFEGDHVKLVHFHSTHLLLLNER